MELGVVVRLIYRWKEKRVRVNQGALVQQRAEPFGSSTCPRSMKDSATIDNFSFTHEWVVIESSS